MKSAILKEEMQKFKTMSFKDKRWYIWEYYKFHIIAVLGVILFLAALLPSFTKKSPVFSCYIINSPLYDEKYTVLKEDFSAYSNLSATEDEWELDATMMLDVENATGTGYEYFMKLSAVIASNGLDVMISNIPTIDHFSAMDAFWDLEEVLPAEILDLVGERLHYVKNEEGIEKAYAIDISDSAVFKNAGINSESLYFTIVGNSPHIDMSILFLKYLLNL